MRRFRQDQGFTLVEALVVITTISLLTSIMLPAVQAAREASRRALCATNLKQISLACLNCDSAILHYPAGGWAAFFAPDPDRGTGVKQPGGPIFNMLPYMEQSALYEMTLRRTGTDREINLRIMLGTPLRVLMCPSRRPAQAYPQMSGLDTSSQPVHPQRYVSGAPGEFVNDVTTTARTDYAGNGYHYWSMHYADATYDNPAITACEGNVGSSSWGTGGSGVYGMDTTVLSVPSALRQWLLEMNYGVAGKSGMFFPASAVTMGQIRDGTSRTYLFGEKYANPDLYTTGQQHGDCFDVLGGSGPDVLRYSASHGIWLNLFCYAYRDTPGYLPEAVWGSAHTGGFNMAFCDGSVHTISYAISTTVHDLLGNRNDGEVIDSEAMVGSY